MKAWKLNDIGDIKFYEDLPVPETGADEVLLKVKAVGICGSDIPRVYKTGAHRMPIIIGHEFSGVVEKTGENVDKSFLGKRMGVFPLIPCRKCPSCLKKKYEMCSNYNYLGSRTDGGFSEYVVVPYRNLIEIPEVVTFEQAAMLEPMAVAVHAMRQLELNESDTVIVCGVGTIGLLLTMFLMEIGMKKVYAIGNKEFQRSVLMDIGLPEGNYIDAKNGDVRSLVMQKTDGIGADAYFECVGRNETIADSLELVRAGGRICLMGNPVGDMTFARDNYWKILRKQLTLKGTWNSSFLGTDEGSVDDDWHYVLSKLSLGRVRPERLITHRLQLSELEKGLLIMKDKTEDYVKIMVKNYV